MVSPSFENAYFLALQLNIFVVNDLEHLWKCLCLLAACLFQEVRGSQPNGIFRSQQFPLSPRYPI